MFNGLRKYILPLAFIYFVSPIDLMPLFPVDDWLVVALALVAYFKLANPASPRQWASEKEYHDDEDDVITTSWSVVDDEEETK